LTARKRKLLALASASELDSKAREAFAEQLDMILAKLRDYSAKLAELEKESNG
jgi:hypothetical protein